jgi:hypothetical protein
VRAPDSFERRTYSRAVIAAPAAGAQAAEFEELVDAAPLAGEQAGDRGEVGMAVTGGLGYADDCHRGRALMSSGPCHLLTTERFPDGTRVDVERLETLVHDSHFAVDVARCRACEQLWIDVFVEVVGWGDGKDDCWNFYVPVSREEVEALRQEIAADIAEKRRRLKEAGYDPDASRHISIRPARDLVETRRHLVYYPDRWVGWSEGRPGAFIAGPG